jgi:hypothetical protein
VAPGNVAHSGDLAGHKPQGRLLRPTLSPVRPPAQPHTHPGPHGRQTGINDVWDGTIDCSSGNRRIQLEAYVTGADRAAFTFTSGAGFDPCLSRAWLTSYNEPGLGVAADTPSYAPSEMRQLKQDFCDLV